MLLLLIVVLALAVAALYGFIGLYVVPRWRGWPTAPPC